MKNRHDKPISKWWRLIWIPIIIGFIAIARGWADSGAEAYCKCKASTDLASCNACCKQDCHDTNWGGDFWGICTGQCQKSCALYNDPMTIVPDVPAPVCLTTVSGTANQ